MTNDNMRYIRGSERHQHSLLTLDDCIDKSHAVRHIDRFCEDFWPERTPSEVEGKGNKSTGRKAYHPVDLLKLLVYSYFNGIMSSRRIERECGRNIELRWLVSGLVPDHKTISDFRKDNGGLIREFFVYLSRHFVGQGLMKGKAVSVDGTKVKAYASSGMSLKELGKKLENVETQLRDYLDRFSKMDTAEDEVEELESAKEKLEKEIGELGSKKKEIESGLSALRSEGVTGKCLSDPDARMMKGRYGSFWGFNLQIGVDVESHMVTEYRLCSNQNDKGLLGTVVEGSREVTGQQVEEASADAGYYKQPELSGLEQSGTACYVAVNHTAKQCSDRENGISFEYDGQQDRYTCSQGRQLGYKRKKTENGDRKRVYESENCSGCPLKEACTTTDRRTVTRSENQEWIDGFREKMEGREGREKMKQRRSVAEHPFGTMKYYMGQTPVLLRGRKKVASEMGLHVIGYNIRRYMNLKKVKTGGKEPVQARSEA